MKPAKTALGANNMIAIVAGSAMIAVHSLVRSTQTIGRVGRDRAEAAFARLVGSYRT